MEIDVESINLCRPIDLLLIGTSKGNLLICRWPDIATSFQLENKDGAILANNNIHQNKIVMAKFSLNYRFIFTVSSTG